VFSKKWPEQESRAVICDLKEVICRLRIFSDFRQVLKSAAKKFTTFAKTVFCASS
jgi:hypothetical protein